MSYPSWPASIDPWWLLYWWTRPGPHNPHHPNVMMHARPGSGPEPATWGGEPNPIPWRGAASIIFEAVNAKQVAATLPEGEQRTQLETRAETTIERILDDTCGTPRPGTGQARRHGSSASHPS